MYRIISFYPRYLVIIIVIINYYYLLYTNWDYLHVECGRRSVCIATTARLLEFGRSISIDRSVCTSRINVPTESVSVRLTEARGR